MASLDDVTMRRMRSAVRSVSRRARPVAAYLFGSHAEGRADQWSDYDLAVFVEGAEEWSMLQMARFCSEVQKEAGDDIELHVFSASQATRPESASFARFVIDHGVPLPLEDTSVEPTRHSG